jgi:hypothetical protein
MSYYDLFKTLSAADLSQMTTSDARVGELAVAPNLTSVQYDLWTKADGETDYVFRRSASFSAGATLAGAVTALQTTFTVADPRSLPPTMVGQMLMIDDERLAVVDFDTASNLVTVKRGVGDTIPRPHVSGARVWFPDDDLTSDSRTYAEGETVFTKALTRISTDVLPIADAAEDSIELVGRFARPYPVADLKVGGVSIYDDSIRSDLLFTWATRNRVLQQDQLVGHQEAGVVAEDGTTYTIKIWNSTGTVLLREENGITTNAWSYTAEKIFSDMTGATFLFDIYVERDGIKSVEGYHLPVRRETAPQAFGVLPLSGSATASTQAGANVSGLLVLSGSATGTVS